MFMGEWTINVFKRIGMEEGEAIESKMLTNGIMKAQKKSKSATSWPAKTCSITTK